MSAGAEEIDPPAVELPLGDAVPVTPVADAQAGRLAVGEPLPPRRLAEIASRRRGNLQVDGNPFWLPTPARR